MIMTCHNCGRKNRIPDTPGQFKCGNCGTLFLPAELKRRRSIRQRVGWCAAGGIWIGVFCPALTRPFLGTRSFFSTGWIIGILVLLPAAYASGQIQVRKWRRVRFAGIAILLIVLIKWGLFSMDNSDLTNALLIYFPVPRNGLQLLILSSVRLEWGWALLFGGAGALIVLAGGVARSRLAARPSAAAVIIGLLIFLAAPLFDAQSELPEDIHVTGVGGTPLPGSTVVIQSVDGSLTD